MRKRIHFYTICKYIFLILFCFITLYPLFWIAISSLKTNQSIFAHPFAISPDPKWENYIQAWQFGNIPRHFLNTLYYAVCTVLAVGLISSMSAYILGKVKPNKFIYNYFAMGIMIPFNAIIIPFIILFRSMGIMNTRIGIILGFIVTNIAFSIFILTPFMKAIPSELEEAAIIDGSNRLQIFWHIIIPISKAGLATVAIFVLLGCWNDLFLSLLLISRQNLLSLNQIIYNMRSQHTADYGLISAAVMIMILPIIALYSVFQKQIVRGMTMGSVKG